MVQCALLCLFFYVSPYSARKWKVEKSFQYRDAGGGSGWMELTQRREQSWGEKEERTTTTNRESFSIRELDSISPGVFSTYASYFHICFHNCPFYLLPTIHPKKTTTTQYYTQENATTIKKEERRRLGLLNITSCGLKTITTTAKNFSHTRHILEN